MTFDEWWASAEHTSFGGPGPLGWVQSLARAAFNAGAAGQADAGAAREATTEPGIVEAVKLAVKGPGFDIGNATVRDLIAAYEARLSAARKAER